MSKVRSVGMPSPRVEGQQKVGGIAVYAVDVALPDMLWAKVLRSPIAHGRIKKIDVSKALAVPGRSPASRNSANACSPSTRPAR